MLPELLTRGFFLFQVSTFKGRLNNLCGKGDYTLNVKLEI